MSTPRPTTTLLPEAAAAAWVLLVLAEEVLQPAIDCLAQWRGLPARLFPLLPSDMFTRATLALLVLTLATARWPAEPTPALRGWCASALALPPLLLLGRGLGFAIDAAGWRYPPGLITLGAIVWVATLFAAAGALVFWGWRLHELMRLPRARTQVELVRAVHLAAPGLVAILFSSTALAQDWKGATPLALIERPLAVTITLSGLLVGGCLWLRLLGEPPSEVLPARPVVSPEPSRVAPAPASAEAAQPAESDRALEPPLQELPPAPPARTPPAPRAPIAHLVAAAVWMLLFLAVGLLVPTVFVAEWLPEMSAYTWTTLPGPDPWDPRVFPLCGLFLAVLATAPRPVGPTPLARALVWLALVAGLLLLLATLLWTAVTLADVGARIDAQRDPTLSPVEGRGFVAGVFFLGGGLVLLLTAGAWLWFAGAILRHPCGPLGLELLRAAHVAAPAVIVSAATVWLSDRRLDPGLVNPALHLPLPDAVVATTTAVWIGLALWLRLRAPVSESASAPPPRAPAPD